MIVHDLLADYLISFIFGLQEAVTDFIRKEMKEKLKKTYKLALKGKNYFKGK